MKKITYKKSGVDIDKANFFVQNIQPLVKKTQKQKKLRQLSGFGALFEFHKNKYKRPIFVSSTDGVGTKLKIAQQLNKHDTVGIDLVAMNVNDILCLGAKPLFFLDYIACGKVKVDVLYNVVKGITAGCLQADCALIGGETAEMPGMYSEEEYDLAGFAVGVVEKNRIIDGSRINAGDKVIGIQSNGLHSNGFSLVRKVFSKNEIKKYAYELLKPTLIYVKPVLALIEKFDIKGIAHITGGAFYGKLTRILPRNTNALIDKSSWQVPYIFKLIQKKGNIDEHEMFRTFNMGIGMVLAVSPKDVSRTKQILNRYQLKSWEIGEVIKGKKAIEIV